MIYQVAPVKTETQPLAPINKGLVQVRHIQARLHAPAPDEDLPTVGEIWSPMTSGPYIVPIVQWFD